MVLDPLLVSAIAAVITGVVGAGVKKVWVWGWVLADKEKQLAASQIETLFWRTAALKALGHTDKAIKLAATVVTKPPGDG
jgi:hypothetical protein